MTDSPFSIKFLKTFESDFRKLDRQVQQRIHKKIREAAANPGAVCRPFRHMQKDLQGIQKLRAGDYRVLLWIDKTNRILTLYSVEHRSTIYRDL